MQSNAAHNTGSHSDCRPLTARFERNHGRHQARLRPVQVMPAERAGSSVPTPAARDICRQFFNAGPAAALSGELRVLLRQQLQASSSFDLGETLPATPGELDQWMTERTLRTGERYHAYLAARKAGGPRQFFTSRSHALYFLQAIASTKLVDGSWLYSTLQHSADPRYTSLIRTYLEELGDGQAEMNHVCIYKKLLSKYTGDAAAPDQRNFPDDYFTQCAIQLALASHGDEFMPEVIGFNLGYEQLPFHLMVTAYELNELNIDPYYFSLHMTIDNAASGHAKAAVQAVIDLMPSNAAGAKIFYERVRRGYELNNAGASTEKIISDFNLDAEILDVFQRKAEFGKIAHSDYCRIGGKTVNEWLASPELISQFLATLCTAGWIHRHQHPDNSRFWKLLQGPRGEMFGVFSEIEKQIIFDWICGDMSEPPLYPAETNTANTSLPGNLSFRHHQRLLERKGDVNLKAAAMPCPDDTGVTALKSELQQQKTPAEQLQVLIRYMAPNQHFTPAGLLATQLFATRL